MDVLTAPMALESFHDQRLERLISGLGCLPREAMSGVHEFDGVGAFGYQSQGPTKLGVKKANQCRLQSLTFLQRIVGCRQGSEVKLFDNSAKNLVLARKVVVKRGT